MLKSQWNTLTNTDKIVDKARWSLKEQKNNMAEVSKGWGSNNNTHGSIFSTYISEESSFFVKVNKYLLYIMAWPNQLRFCIT